jgi:hypothetical protein
MHVYGFRNGFNWQNRFFRLRRYVFLVLVGSMEIQLLFYPSTASYWHDDMSYRVSINTTSRPISNFRNSGVEIQKQETSHHR